MTRTTLAVLLAGLLTVHTASAENCTPSWCQADQLSTVEKMVCEQPMLSRADQLMTQLYQEVMSYKGKAGHEGMWYREVESNQKDWLASRNKATTAPEILALYMSRSNDLYGWLTARQQ